MVNWAMLPAWLAEAPLTFPLAASLAEAPLMSPLAASLAEAAVVSLLEETRFSPLVPCSDIFFSFPDQVSEETEFCPKTTPLLYLFPPQKKPQRKQRKTQFCQFFENAAFFYPERERE
jgi:hypothetical protein